MKNGFNLNVAKAEKIQTHQVQNKEARFKIVSANRQISQEQGLKVLELSRMDTDDLVTEQDQELARKDELKDQVLCNLMPMVREYCSIPQESKPFEFVYDVYVQDDSVLIQDCIVGQLQWDAELDDYLMMDSDSDDSSQECDDYFDSNAECKKN